MPFLFKRECVSTPVGDMVVLTDSHDKLRALDWTDYEPRMLRLLRLHYGVDAVALEAHEGHSRSRRALEAYLAGSLHALDEVEVETGGTTFQREVWSALRKIPAGETRSYGELACTLGRPLAVRAVGLANGANPVGVVVPCHRVVGANSSLTGYGGGLHRKRWLLQHEGISWVT